MLQREFILRVFKTVILIACVLFRVFLGEDEVESDNRIILSNLHATRAFENGESIIDIKPVFILEDNLIENSNEKVKGHDISFQTY